MKRFLKLILPIKFLKAAFLLYNKIKIQTLDRVLYNRYKEESAEVQRRVETNPFLSMKIDLSKFTEEVRVGFQRWQDSRWMQDEYIVKIKKRVFIDGLTGWGVLNRDLVYSSLGFAYAPHVHKPGIFRILSKSKRAKKLDSIISLRDTGEENYFHFFNDLLPKIWFAKDYNLLNANVQIVVSAKLWQKEYFQYFLQHQDLKNLSWYVQKEEWVQAEQAIFCKPLTHTKKYWDKIVQHTASIATNESDLNVFITRSKQSLRYIENEEALLKVLEYFGFTIVDAGTLTFEEQVRLFARARILAGIHGAGLSNMIFRGNKPMTVVEIFPPGPYLPFHYIMLSQMFGYRYEPLIGVAGKERNKGGFKVNLVELESRLAAIQ
jgi:capsular polysaccharide biosynthesis protein